MVFNSVFKWLNSALPSTEATVAVLPVRNLADWKAAVGYCSEELQVSDKGGPAMRDLWAGVANNVPSSSQ
jgi:hypothetical protein